MRADEIAEDYPAVSCESGALDAVRLLAEHRLPGIVVTDSGAAPTAVLPASQVVRFLVPGYVLDDPSLAGVLTESMADRVADKLAGKTVRDLLPRDKPAEPPVVRGDDTVVEVAALMARNRCPLVAVVERGRMLGVITASRLLQVALAPE
ncbi:MAG: CBS domain-containing protein [Mycobacteriaceae bacterium]|nr:CBS domain-containing protein [Mycobacteriaceae bacterium]